MLVRILLIVALLCAVPARSQVEPSATGGATYTGESPMTMPPFLSGGSLHSGPGGKTESNYLYGGIVFNTAYTDNVFAGMAGTPVGDVTYSIWPKIELEHNTTKQSMSLQYSSGFTFYRRESVLDAINQSAALNSQYRLTPHATIYVQDTFRQNSNVFDQPFVLSEGTVSGLTSSPTATVIAPLANLYTNTADAGLSYQFSRVGMIGGGATFALLDYPNPKQVPGLYNSRTEGGDGFYSHLLSGNQYIGGTYEYSIVSTPSANATTQLQTLSLFYSLELKHEFSFSVSSGPENSYITWLHAPSSSSWAPNLRANVAWERNHAGVSIGYARAVTSGEGLLGANNTNSADGGVHWNLARDWTINSAASYFISKNVSAQLNSLDPGGHGVTGTASVGHLISQHIRVECGYSHLHESYGAIATIPGAPDSDREFISIAYEFKRALGR